MTERDGYYQLSVDLPGIADEPEFVFSTTMILDAEKNNSATRRDLPNR